MRAEDSHVVVFLLGLWNDRWVGGLGANEDADVDLDLCGCANVL